MRIRVSDKEFSSHKTDLAACFAYEGDRLPRSVGDKALARRLGEQMKAERFRGKGGDVLIGSTGGAFGARRYVVIGLGADGQDATAALRLGCARAARECARFSAGSLALQLPLASGGSPAEDVRAVVEGVALGTYSFDRHLTDAARRSIRVESLTLCANGQSARLKKEVKLGEVAARALDLGRDLVNEAPSRMTPAALARVAVKEARARGLQCKVLGAADLRRIGAKALLAVSRGSKEPPRVVHLTYKPAKARGRGKKAKRIVLVGKGVTFDSGGLNLKLGDHMLEMKADMAGAAAVLAAMTTLKEVGCRAEVHAFLGLVENMTGAWAYKPGDILETYSGKTVEVGNTDAEGRLVLCDLLAHAAKTLKPDTIVDLATLTGACVVALGTMATGLFTRDAGLRDALSAAGAESGEKLWPMPMYEEYLQLLQNGPADLRNVGGRWGGAITAALFLGEFVPRNVPWAHLDIAGPAFDSNGGPTTAPGATGAGVLTLMRWLGSV